MFINQNKSKDIDSFVVCETWINNVYNEILQIDNYAFKTKDKINKIKTKAGGILFRYT